GCAATAALWPGDGRAAIWQKRPKMATAGTSRLFLVMAAPGHFVPGVSRPSTSLNLFMLQGVDARHEAGHDGLVSAAPAPSPWGGLLVGVPARLWGAGGGRRARGPGVGCRAPGAPFRGRGTAT